MQTLFLILPMPPTINSYYQYQGHRRFVGLAGKKFKTEVAQIVSQSAVRFGAVRLELSASFHFANKRKQDTGNRLKALEDALVQAGLMNDDSQIDIHHLYRGELIKGGKVYVTITALE